MIMTAQHLQSLHQFQNVALFFERIYTMGKQKVKAFWDWDGLEGVPGTDDRHREAAKKLKNIFSAKCL